VAKIMANSHVLNNLVAGGKVKVVAARHDIGTGKITWFS
jgi:carbonic anhydrase